MCDLKIIIKDLLIKIDSEILMLGENELELKIKNGNNIETSKAVGKDIAKEFLKLTINTLF